MIKEFPSALIEQVSDGDSMIKRVMESEWTWLFRIFPCREEAAGGIAGNKGAASAAAHSYFERAPGRALCHPGIKGGRFGLPEQEYGAGELINAVHRVLLGRKYITPSVAEKAGGANQY